MVIGVFNMSYVNTSKFRSDRCRKPYKSRFAISQLMIDLEWSLCVFPWCVHEKSKQRSLQNSVLLEHICLHATAEHFLLYSCHSDICMGGWELIFKTHSAMQWYMYGGWELIFKTHSAMQWYMYGGWELIFKTRSAMQVWNRKQTSVDTKNWFTHFSWLLQVQRLSHWVSAFSRFENKFQVSGCPWHHTP